MLTTLFLFFSALIIVLPFSHQTIIDHMKTIDPQKFPTLARYQRIVRAKNTKAREKELKLLETQRKERQQKAISEMQKQHEIQRVENQAHHKELTDFWDGMFREARAKEIEQERLAAIEKKRKEEAAFEERRVRELAMWQESERIRLEKFKAEKARQDELDRKEKERVWGELDRKRQELDLYYTMAQAVGTDSLTAAGGLSVPASNDYSIFLGASFDSTDERSVAVHGVYVRTHPSKKARIINNLSQNERIRVDGWAVGEELYGNPIWFRQTPVGKGLAGWVWSGAFDNKSTTALPRLFGTFTEMEHERFTQNSENAFAKLAEMYADPKKHLLAQEVAELQSKLTELDNLAVDALQQINAPEPKPSSLSIDAGRLNFGVITADKLTVHSISTDTDSLWQDINRMPTLSGRELTSLKKRVQGEFYALSNAVGNSPTRDDVDRMNELADANDSIQSEEIRRAKFRTDRTRQVRY